jgi:hypothetical protein
VFFRKPGIILTDGQLPVSVVSDMHSSLCLCEPFYGRQDASVQLCGFIHDFHDRIYIADVKYMIAKPVSLSRYFLNDIMQKWILRIDFTAGKEVER